MILFRFEISGQTNKRLSLNSRLLLFYFFYIILIKLDFIF